MFLDENNQAKVLLSSLMSVDDLILIIIDDDEFAWKFYCQLSNENRMYIN